MKMWDDCKIRRHVAEDDLSNFTCGDDDLDDFIRNDAVFYAEERLASNYIMTSDEGLLAYFSLANDRISFHDFNTLTEFNRFRRKKFVNSKRIKGYPAVKVCRLAVDVRSKGLGVGTFLLDFIKMFLYRKTKSACRFITVDANPDAVPFYQKNGFQQLSKDSYTCKRTIPMYFDLSEMKRI